MKHVLLINGSPHKNGCTFTALSEIAAQLEKNGVSSEIVSIGTGPVRGCIACGGCRRKGECVFGDDPANEIARKLAEADGVIIGSPIYYAGPNGALLALLDRVFFSRSGAFDGKPGAAIVSCRRGGNSATFEAMNQFFGINGMPTAPSTYWNDVHGYTAEDVYADEEGVETVRNLAQNMIFLMRSIRAGKEQFGKPEVKHQKFTHFVR